MTVFEYLLDNTYDRVSKQLDTAAKTLKKFKTKS